MIFARSTILMRVRQTGGKWGIRIVLKPLKPSARTDAARPRYNHIGSGRKRNMMKTNNNKLIGGMLTLAVVLAAVTGQAQTSQPSSKVTAKTANLILVKDTTGTAGWQTLFSNTIKTANQKDLFISASFEVGLY